MSAYLLLTADPTAGLPELTDVEVDSFFLRPQMSQM